MAGVGPLPANLQHFVCHYFAPDRSAIRHPALGHSSTWVLLRSVLRGRDGWQDANTKPKGSKSHDGYILMMGRMTLFNCVRLETEVGRMVPYRPPLERTL